LDIGQGQFEVFGQVVVGGTKGIVFTFEVFKPSESDIFCDRQVPRVVS
jgi:hypothetical protein